MPGPSNSKKKKKGQAKKQKRVKAQHEPPAEQSVPIPPADSRSPSLLAPSPTSSPAFPPSVSPRRYRPLRSQPLRFRSSTLTPSPPPPPEPPHPARVACEPQKDASDALLRPPCVEDLGSGPHVRDIGAFLDSRIAAPPSADDALCAEFAQREVLEMLRAVLPAETAMIMWYNKSRLRSRVCPACKRLYHLGDALQAPLLDDDEGDLLGSRDMEGEPRRRHSEQRISGICSALCFVLAAYRYPAAIRSTWGRMAEELSDEVWDELDGPGLGDRPDTMGLSMMLKMTRCHDLGLGQLFFPGQDMDDAKEEHQQAFRHSEVVV
ncbi:hypothetical protein PHLGIDRAFT_116347 [Phlebiopsis gigantea 11061_1 CR5-6]|uniref:Uncharacterized protein n=1 Tax=Phlebiopsis gigantea (strain 11061_1 CR5-6) TaxID=745531 RepID=A0A0C3S2C5_PHLG1|nr:hypothetical protein PHLGIDRAFT_116347 [Phlebiopsis gigantea 11061_1 CR5-6]